jgi:hypothetical protein
MLDRDIRGSDPAADEGVAPNIDAAEGARAVLVIDEALDPGGV